MGAKLGTIVSTDETPTPTDFRFVLTGDVEKDQFVEFDTGNGRAIARVSDVTRTNRYFREAESVSEYEKSGTPIEAMVPTDDWEYREGVGTVLGVYQEDGVIRRPTTAPSPGDPVEEVDLDRLEDFLGLDSDGIDIGEIQHHGLDAELNLTDTFQKHLAILAQTGAGKSYLATVILEELLDRGNDDGQLAVLVLDPHGEYSGMAKDSSYGSEVKVFSEGNIQIGVPELSAGRLDHYFSDVTGPQIREMSDVISELRESKGVYGIADIIAKLEEKDINDKTREAWLNRLRRMKYMDIFGSSDAPSSNDLEPGQMVVLDLSDIVDRKKKQFIASHFSRKFFSARRENQVPPFFLLVEEAHNFIPEGASSADAPARAPITRIAREGRKFHASLGLVSQRPAKLSQTALSQCNTNFILRITNPHDLDRIKQGSEGITSDVLEDIPGLRVGEGVVVGEAVNYPAFVDVRERKSEEADAGKDLEEAAKQYQEKERKADEDAEAFV